MSALSLADVLDITSFIAARPALERELIEAKRIRRVALGPNLVLLFENRATLLWQVQEMCRVEHITRPDAVQHELDTYAALLPRPRELSATLLIGFDDPHVRDRELRRLLGLHEHLELRLAGCEPAHARFDHDQFNEERVSAVQFVRIPLTDAQHLALANLTTPAELAVTHPACVVRTPLAGVTRAALLDDLATAAPR